ncbi:PolB DNA polymerase elongation subunit (family B) [uncultured Caudovirales phage]|uniref:DNA-directed DNA polymerase n=1 Tax=uncultured Caudovirales phage TaxID=2100421 RepID=A0A6J7WHD4_9CAUD|nr:PolB DNA polymerase elongation subunit (family B) [uncultured Caudovirales phage]
MSYIDALFDRDKDRIHVVERVKGERVYREYPANYVFYYDDPRGKFRTIYDTPVSRFSTKNGKEFHKEQRVNSGKRLWESDINPIFRCLEDNYLGANSPKLQTAFFDIEVDFDPLRGFSKPEDPFNPITAISVYLDWMDKLVTMVVPPKSYSWETAQEICNQYDNCFLFEREEDMLNTFLDLIDDADILSGWNSEGFDIPYVTMRIHRVLSKDDTRRLCLWGQFPKQRTFERFGAENLTFDLIGRVHMDYMQLYRKYTYEERHSYSLDAIGEYELDERKLQYEGTLDQLYNKDFPKFIDYNRQDTLLLAKLDKKLRFLDLANELAHDNTVLLQTTMGAVAVTEQAIINEAHSRGMVVPNRRSRDDHGDTQAAGAYVAYPKRGIHEYIGAIDINSLYPSAIRALNMGPETIVGQLRPVMTDHYIKEKIANGSSFADAWENMFGTLEYQAVMNMEPGTELTLDWQDGTSDVMSAADVWRLIFDSNQPWTFSANGTIFRYDMKGIIPGLLERWYAERKEMQAKKKAAETKEDTAFWDKRQLVKKINLNSLYGAILNPGCRFFDQRIGQSTTLTGRIIAKHMDSHVNEAITGSYDHVGSSIIYGDTDSVYFTAWPALKEEIEAGRMEWNREICVQLYDTIGESVNQSFPAFMERACHCPREMGSIIKGGRELIASKGLFIKKKRYAVLIFDMEGVRLDTHGKPGKVKAMGLDLKRSDTPKVVQDFLSEILMIVLTGTGDVKQTVIEKVKEFKIAFAERPAWEKGTPKRVNNLTKYTAEEERLGKANMPGHVRAAMNWNRLKKMHGDNYSTSIVDGMKTIVCKLKDNPLGLTSVGYPTDESHIPNWFKELPFDDNTMESTIVDQKVENLLGVLEWRIAESTDIKTTFDDLFTFE